MITLNVEYLSYEKIAQIANDFLIQNKIDSIPVQIEHIVEYNYNIDIVPAHGLQKGFETEGFTTSDFSCIYVDNYVYEQAYLRYRFTLAHELGHLILHKKYLDEFSFSTIDEWKNFVDQLDNKDQSKMEFQGYAFAGLILVPSDHLERLFYENISKIVPLIQQAKSKGIYRVDYLSYAKDRLATILAPLFEVSTDVIVKRIEYDSLEKNIP